MAQPPPSTHVRSRSFAASERGPGMLGLLRDALSTESGRRYYFCTSEHPPGGTGTAKRTSAQENPLFGRMVNAQLERPSRIWSSARRMVMRVTGEDFAGTRKSVRRKNSAKNVIMTPI